MNRDTKAYANSPVETEECALSNRPNGSQAGKPCMTIEQIIDQYGDDVFRLCLLYLGGYGIIRFFVEGIRTDQLKIAGTNIAVSQMLGIGLFVLSLILEIIIRLRLSKKTNK